MLRRMTRRLVLLPSGTAAAVRGHAAILIAILHRSDGHNWARAAAPTQSPCPSDPLHASLQHCKSKRHSRCAERAGKAVKCHSRCRPA